MLTPTISPTELVERWMTFQDLLNKSFNVGESVHIREIEELLLNNTNGFCRDIIANLVGAIPSHNVESSRLYYFVDGREYIGNVFDNDATDPDGIIISAARHARTRKLRLNYYRGNVKNGECEGNGELLSKVGLRNNKITLYRGEFQNHLAHGRGVLHDTQGNFWKGQFCRGDFLSGQGLLIQNDGSVFTGEVQRGKAHGLGVQRCPNGDFAKGEFFKGDFRSGRARVHNADGDIYEGEMQRGIAHGRGKVTLINGGQFEDLFYKSQRLGYYPSWFRWFPQGKISDWTLEFFHQRKRLIADLVTPLVEDTAWAIQNLVKTLLGFRLL